MPVLNEGRYAGEFLVSEGNGRISRETITMLSGQNLQAAAVLGKVTASGKYKALDPAAVDGQGVQRRVVSSPSNSRAARGAGRDGQPLLVPEPEDQSAARVVTAPGI